MTTTFAALDSRKRLNLAQFASSDVYLITTEPNGRIILDPARVVSAVEEAALSNPRIIAALDAHDAHPEDVFEEP